jgi:hypothetical protein
MEYVIDTGHDQNQGKGRVFQAIGYTRENWDLLERDIRSQHLTQEALEVEPTRHGRKFHIIAPLQGPTGTANILSVWIIRHGEDFPRFVTAHRYRRVRTV